MHDGFSFDVYDVHIFSNNGTVPPGGELIPWTGNPFLGTGAVNPVITGTRTEGVHVIATDNQGAKLGFDLNGDGSVEGQSSTDSNGFLDAEDIFGRVQLASGSQLRTLDTAIQRSFYLASREAGFHVSTQAKLIGGAGDLNQIARLGNVAFDYQITLQGVDNGMSFGNAAGSGGFRKLGAFSNLGALTGAPQLIAEFPTPIRSRFDDALPEQSIRFDYIYGFEGYDLSLGAGDLHYEIEFRFFRN